MNKETNKRSLTIAILSVAFLQIMASTSTSPTLSLIAHEYSSVPFSTIQLTMTLPSIFIILMSFVIVRLLDKFTIKTLMLTGIAIYFIGVLGGAFSINLLMLLICRSILGIGLGIFTPLLSITISGYYKDASRTQMMGFMHSFDFLGGITGTVLGGFLATQNWRHVFYLALFAIPAFILVSLAFDNKKPQVATENSQKSCSGKLTKRSLLYGSAMLFHGLLFFKPALSLSSLYQQIGIDNPAYAGISVGCIYVGCFIAGLIFKSLRTQVKQFTLPIACILIAFSFLILGFSTSTSLIILGTVLAGLGGGIFAPMIFCRVPETVPIASISRSLTLVNTCLYLGMFLAPYGSVFVKNIGNGTWKFDFCVAAAIEFILAIVSYILSDKPGQKQSREKCLCP